jgi:cyclopropane-fatty-acyl-phospholipid synthase
MRMEKNIIEGILPAAGISINGANPGDIQVRNDQFYERVLRDGSLGLGESYMEEWWDCQRLDAFFYRLLSARLDQWSRNGFIRLSMIIPYLINRQSRSRSRVVAERHYDLGNDLFLSYLDPYNQYSCACFNGDGDLASAQINKLDLICRKAGIKPGDRVLDIGCGWGGFARYAAEKYGCAVTALNISREQIDYAREFCRSLPVEILQCDYRDLRGTFDKIISIGMFEHVGRKNYGTFMKAVNRCLKDDGIFLLQTIGSNESHAKTDDWVDRYIFPNGQLPSIAWIGRAIEGLFVMEDWHNLGPHYDRTLMAWHENFQKAWPSLKSKYDERFKRMWEYYLLSCAGAFRARNIQLWQIVLTKYGTAQPACR